MRVGAQRTGRAARDDRYDGGRIGTVGRDPRPAAGIEDGTQPARALRRVPAASGVEADVNMRAFVDAAASSHDRRH